MALHLPAKAACVDAGHLYSDRPAGGPQQRSTSPGPDSSKYLQHHSSLASSTTVDQSRPSKVGGLDEPSPFLLCVMAAINTASSGSSVHNELPSFTSKASSRQLNIPGQMSPQISKKQSLNTLRPSFDASQPLSQYSIMPDKIDSTQETTPTSHQNNNSVHGTTMTSHEYTMLPNGPPTEPAIACSLTDILNDDSYVEDNDRILPTSFTNAGLQTQARLTPPQSSNPSPEMASNGLADPEIADPSTTPSGGNTLRDDHVNGELTPRTLSPVQSSSKRKRTCSVDGIEITTLNPTRVKTTSPAMNAENAGAIETTTAPTATATSMAGSRHSRQARTSTPRAASPSEVLHGGTSESSELSEPPDSLGPTPTGLISPDERFLRPQLSGSGDGSPVHRSYRVRKASVKAAGAQNEKSSNLHTSRRFSEPFVKHVTFDVASGNKRRASFDSSVDIVTKKQKTDKVEADHNAASTKSTPTPGRSTRRTRANPTAEHIETPTSSTKPGPKNKRVKKQCGPSTAVKVVHSVTASDSVGASPNQPPADAYGSDQGPKRLHRGNGRGGRGGHNGRGRGGRGRGGTSGRGRGDSPERPVKHILTTEEKSEIARLKRRQAELRQFFQFVGTQQTEILDVLAGRDLAILTRKARAHEKYPDHGEVVEDLAFHRDAKVSQIKALFETAKEMAAKELEAQKELVKSQFRTRVESARQEHIEGAAGDLAIFKKAIAAGGDDAYTLAGSEADYFPRYHELPEADATVRGYNSSKIEDEKPFRRDLPSFDEVAARDVMEDEVTRPVVEALHKKRAEEQAAIARERQARLAEEALEHSQTIDALAEFANSERGKRDIADVVDFLDPRSMRAPQYGSFGLSSLADAAEIFARPLQTHQYSLLPPPPPPPPPPPAPPVAPIHYQSGYANVNHQKSRSLHFPPPPPKLYIPQNSPPSFSAHNSPLRPASTTSATNAGSVSNLNSTTKHFHTSSLPPTPQQTTQHPPHLPAMTSTPTPTSSSARRSLRSIAPQPPPLAATNSTPQSANQYQTYTFVPPQQPPQSTHFAPTVVPAKRSSPATTSIPASATTILAPAPPPPPPPPAGFSATGVPGLRPLGQAHNGIPTSYSGNARGHNIPAVAPERRTSGSKQGQGKIAMQFFNSIIDGNGKRALLPKP